MPLQNHSDWPYARCYACQWMWMAGQFPGRFSELHRKLLLKGCSWVLRRGARPESLQSQPLCTLVTGFMVFKTSLWSYTKYHAGASGGGSWGWEELFKAGTVLMEEEDGLPSAQTQRAASLGCTPGEREYEVPGTERCWLTALALWKMGYTVRRSAPGVHMCVQKGWQCSLMSHLLFSPLEIHKGHDV